MKTTIITPQWVRLSRIIQWTGLNINRFAQDVGLPRSESLYQIKRGNNSISVELAAKIKQRYPTISSGWLLTGEGSMFVADVPDSTLDPLIEIKILVPTSKIREIMKDLSEYGKDMDAEK